MLGVWSPPVTGRPVCGWGMGRMSDLAGMAVGPHAAGCSGVGKRGCAMLVLCLGQGERTLCSQTDLTVMTSSGTWEPRDLDSHYPYWKQVTLPVSRERCRVTQGNPLACCLGWAGGFVAGNVLPRASLHPCLLGCWREQGDGGKPPTMWQELLRGWGEPGWDRLLLHRSPAAQRGEGVVVMLGAGPWPHAEAPPSQASLCHPCPAWKEPSPGGGRLQSSSRAISHPGVGAMRHNGVIGFFQGSGSEGDTHANRWLDSSGCVCVRVWEGCGERGLGTKSCHISWEDLQLLTHCSPVRFQTRSTGDEKSLNSPRSWGRARSSRCDCAGLRGSEADTALCSSFVHPLHWVLPRVLAQPLPGVWGPHSCRM